MSADRSELLACGCEFNNGQLFPCVKHRLFHDEMHVVEVCANCRVEIERLSWADEVLYRCPACREIEPATVLITEERYEQGGGRAA